jgi:hypothetical protein
MLIAHTDYEKTKNEYLELVNRKKELEKAINANTNDPEAAALLRSDYRIVVDKLEKIYANNINYFN